MGPGSRLSEDETEEGAFDSGKVATAGTGRAMERPLLPGFSFFFLFKL